MVGALLSTLLSQSSPSFAQYSIDWSKIAGGGNTTPGTGGPYSLVGTLGQHDAHDEAGGGIYSISGGFWVADFSGNQPVLLMQRSNNVFTIAWPLTTAGYCLETTYNLAPPVVWSPVTTGITTNGSTLILQITNTTAVAKQFFRLANPCSAPPSVALGFAMSNNVSTVTWPGGAFRLQTAFNLAQPISWQTVSNGIATVGANKVFTFTNNPAVTNQFFRLVYP